MYTVDKHQVEPYDFLFYFSPTIPYDYPKEKVPPNLCELPLLKVYKCFLDYTKNADELKRAKHCRMYSAEFNNCKKRRDMQIFKDIRS